MLVSDLAAQLGGDLEFKNRDGAVVTVRFSA
ncbi:hypothetical protein BH11MYX1_BH11MYX1_53420 [soil metagenome]